MTIYYLFRVNYLGICFRICTMSCIKSEIEGNHATFNLSLIEATKKATSKERIQSLLLSNPSDILRTIEEQETLVAKNINPFIKTLETPI